LITDAIGGATTGTAAKFPAVVVTLAATQQGVFGEFGVVTYHQVPDEFFPEMVAVWSISNALITNQSVLGPKRQFTLTSEGQAIGTVGVPVAVGGGVSVGRNVCVGSGVSVSGTAVFSAVGEGGAGVSVGKLDGKLHAETNKAITNNKEKARAFIGAPDSFI